MSRKTDWRRWVKLAAMAVVLAGAVYLDFDCGCCDDYENVIEIHVLDETDWYYELETPDAEKDCHA
ncbi:MAG: hypothetical protein JSU73_03875, partial [candidate division WOR-3 bacterium]